MSTLHRINRAVDEEIVRQYRCIRIKQWFTPETTGLLTITNQRVIYHAEAHSIVGKSANVSEIPLDDISGINAFKGVSINWLWYILFAASLYIVSAIGQSIASWIFSIPVIVLLIVPQLILILGRSRIIAEDVKNDLQSWIKQQFSTRSIEYSPALISNVVYWMFVTSMVILIWYIANISDVRFYFPAISPIIMLIGYFLLYMRVIGYQPRFVLVITSKTAQGSGITIDGAGSSTIFVKITPSIDAFQGSPAEDADAVIHELGAILTDIRALGLFGIQRWSQTKHSEPSTEFNA